MRLFTAIPLPKEKKIIVSDIMRGRLPVTYINTTNLHITLNFLGEVEPNRVESVKDAILKALVDEKPFDITFDKLQKFRHQIHLTLRTNLYLERLQKTLTEKFLKNGFILENRHYYPHVKLANLHSDQVLRPERRIEFFPQNELTKLNFTADKVILFQSKLLLHYAHHEPITEYKL